VQVDRVAQVQAAEDRENVGLQRGHDEFEPIERDIDGERQETEQPERHGEPGKHRHHRVAGHHVGKEPDAQADRPRQVGDDLDRHQDRRHHNGRPGGEEEGEKMHPVLDERDDRHQQEYKNRQRKGDDDLTGEGEGIGDQPDQIAEQHEHEDREDSAEKFAAPADIILNHAGDEFIRHLGDRLQPSGHQRGAARRGDQERRAGDHDDGHEQRRIRIGDVERAQMQRDQPLDRELLERSASARHVRLDLAVESALPSPDVLRRRTH
jgi:hypothetical protein